MARNTWVNIHVDDYGWVGKLRVVQDGIVIPIQTFTDLKFFYIRPGETEAVEKTASFDTDGADGVLKYIHEDGFIDTVGNWKVWYQVAKTGAEHTGNPLTFYVAERGS